MMRRSLAFLFVAACGQEAVPAAPDAMVDDTTGESFTVRFGPYTVPGGREDTRCVDKRLDNDEAKWIGRLHTRLGIGSHHLIVYRLPDGEERPEPYECFPFIDVIRPEDQGAPLMVSQVEEETLDLPYGVAFGIEAGQMVRLEMHYVNSSDEPIEAEAEATFEVLPPEQFQQEADFLFIGNPEIRLPPGESTLGPSWFPIPEELVDTNVFAMTGHTHQWGTNVVVDHALADDGELTPVYAFDTWSWEEPPVARYKPAIAMPAGSGFSFTCSWDNQSGHEVQFGESTEDEMCFFWAYYYPSQGHKVCFHTDEIIGRPFDVCCPGSSLCDLVDEYF